MKLRAIQLLSRYIGILLVWLFGRIGAEVAPEQITGTSELIATGVGVVHVLQEAFLLGLGFGDGFGHGLD